MATKVSAVCGGTISDQRCCRWLLRGIAVLEELLSLSSEACGADPVLMVSPGGVCRLVRSWREERAQYGIPKRPWPGCGGECRRGVVAWCWSGAVSLAVRVLVVEGFRKAVRMRLYRL